MDFISRGQRVTDWPVDGPFERDIVIIGGCGHVGLPLAIAFADQGMRVGIFDVSEASVALVNDVRMPFGEPGASYALKSAVSEGRLTASTSHSIVASAEHVIVVI